jgi:hypothetical protein
MKPLFVTIKDLSARIKLWTQEALDPVGLNLVKMIEVSVKVIVV